MRAFEMTAVVRKIFKIVTSPKAIIVGMIVGIIVGLYVKPLLPILTPIGDGYKSLLVMAIVPIIFTSLIGSLASMLMQEGMERKVIKICIIFLVSMFATAIISMLVMLLSRNMLVIGSNAQSTLAGNTQIAEFYPFIKTVVVQNNKFSYFLAQFLPSNVFMALTEGLTVKVILIGVFIGIALGKTKSSYREYLLSVVNATNEVFNKIFDWILLVAPLGICAIIAENAAKFNLHILNSLVKFVSLENIVGLVLLGIYITIISVKFKCSPWAFCKVLKNPLLLGFVTMSSTVAMPSSIEALSTIHPQKKMPGLVMPLGITLNRQGEVLLFSIVTILSAFFYNVPLSFGDICLIVLISAVFGTVASGGGPIYIAVFITIAKIVGVPELLGTIILAASELFIAWIGTFVNLFSNYAAVALTIEEQKP